MDVFMFLLCMRAQFSGVAHRVVDDSGVTIGVAKIVVDEFGGQYVRVPLDLTELPLLVLEGPGFQHNDNASACRVGHVHVDTATVSEFAHTVSDSARVARDEESRILHGVTS
jgi:hypothetical protein